MILHEVSSRIQAAGGEVFSISTEQNATLIYADVAGQHCRIIVLRSGQTAPIFQPTKSFLTHVAADIDSLNEWLGAVGNSQPMERGVQF